MRVLVISGCSASKRYDGDIGGATLDRHPREELLDREHDSNQIVPAREMYSGNGHTRVAAAVDHLQTIENIDVEWFIISAGFGTINSETPIVPYDCTLSGNKHTKADYRERADRLGIEDHGQTIDELIRAIGRAKDIPSDILTTDLSQYDFVFAMLGREYLLASADVFEQSPSSTATYVFAPDTMDDLTGSFTRVPANETERRKIDAMRINQKEMQFETLVSHIKTTANLKELVDDPERVHAPSTTQEEGA